MPIPAADAQNLAPDAAESDHAQRLAEELHALVRNPGAAAHLAIHARDIAARREQERNRVLGNRRIAVIPDGVDFDAARRHVGKTHVARRSGAEKDDMLERGAALDQRRRQVGVVVDGDVVAVEDCRQRVLRVGLAIDVDRRIVDAKDALPDRRELIVAVEEQRFHSAAPLGDSLSPRAGRGLG